MKSLRHNAIKQLLVKTTTVSNQDGFRRHLETLGIHTTQATLSRDIRELRLVKGPFGYALPVAPGEGDMPATASVLDDFALEVKQAQNLLVLHTTMGGAQPVAAALDLEAWDGIVGTIAGDNAVLIICPDNDIAAKLKTRIESYLV